MTQANPSTTVGTMNIDAVYTYLKSFNDMSIDCLANVLVTQFGEGAAVDKVLIKAIFDVCLPDMPNAFREMECHVVSSMPSCW